MKKIIKGELGMKWDGGGFAETLDGDFNFISDAIDFDQYSESKRIKITIEEE